VGVTGSLTGPLASLADHVIHRPVHEDAGLPAQYGRCLLHMAEYLAVLYALYAFALEFGVRRGRISAGIKADQLAAIDHAIGQIPRIASAIEPAVASLAERLDRIDTIFTIGAGPSRGTAQYCAAKYHEQMPINGVGCDLEEWAHLEYFLTLAWGQRSVVMVIAPPGNSFDRAQELVTGIANAGGQAIVVTESPGAIFPEACARFDLGLALEEWLSPLVYFLPTQLLLLHMAERAGVPLIPLRRQDGTWLITGGVVRDRADGLN
jgi:glucosamine--fructose-6-phosphate aminotransferase (isomerizing)